MLISGRVGRCVEGHVRLISHSYMVYILREGKGTYLIEGWRG